MHSADHANEVYSGSVLNASQVQKPSKYVQEPIAVVGMACRLPGHSNSPHALWKLLEKGGIAENEPPETRFNLKGHFDGTRKPKTMRSPGGMFLEDVDPREFDAAFFGISKTDATAMDPQQRQLLEVVYECFENAGVTMESINGEAIGCFVGSYGVDYADMQTRDPEDRAPSVTIGVGRAILSNRISHFFNIKGPSMTIDTACSGSLVGVDVACRYLQSGEVNGAICAGANLYLSPEHNLDSGAMKGASSLSGKCHTFDVKADGYIKAEGVNAVLLKRLSDAIRDKDAIRAVIRGTATNSDGRTPGIASPSAEAQAVAIRAAYANAGLTDYNQTKYLECHGTGTQAGDPQEVQGVASVFAESRPIDEPLIVGSIKSNIGHSEPAAGISGLLKAILVVENGMIPGNPTFITPNPKIDFHNLKIKATRTSIPWPRGAIRRASVNSFGYGGSNAHVVVEEPGILVPKSARVFKSSYASLDKFFEDNDDDDSDDLSISSRPYVLVFSANKEGSLQSYIRTMRKHLLNPNVKIPMQDLAYTLSERRTRHFNRGYLVARNSDLDEASAYYGKMGTEAPRVGFVFTGQGAQWVQMGKELVDTFPKAKLILKHLDDVLQAISMPPSWSLLDELIQLRSPETLRQPEFSQPLVTALQLAILSVLKDWGVDKPLGVVGHSSGEIAAAYAAGLLSQEDAIIAAYYRGQAAKHSAAGDSPLGMLAVGLGGDQVAPFLEGLGDSVQVACYNSPSSVTLSGTLEGLNTVKERVNEANHFARLLQVDLAYHSTFMKDIGAKYRDILSKDFSADRHNLGHVTMFSSVLGHKLDYVPGVDYWVSNLLSPVKFDSAVREMISPENGIDFLIEIGPSGALAGPISQIIKNNSADAAKTQYCTALKRGKSAINSLFEVAGRLFVSGGEVDLAKVNEPEEGSTPSLIVDLPNYSWDHSVKYWYENDSSKDWRYRMFPHHELLGSKVLGTSWQAPSWKQTLQLENLAWLKHHKMGSDIVFPGAGYVALAMEAIRQKHLALSTLEETAPIDRPAYRFRDFTCPKALALPEADDGTKIMLSLAPSSKTHDTWHEFKVTSTRGNISSEHCHGLVRIEQEKPADASEADVSPLTYPVPGQLWYKAMHDCGYNFGTLFQKQLEVECVSGKRQSRSMVSLEEIEANEPYPMHPTNIDGCFHTCAPSLWNGNRSGVNAVLIPAVIGEILINPNATSTKGLAVTSAKYSKLGRIEETQNYISEASVYDPETRRLLFQVSGFRYHKLEIGGNPYSKHTFSRLLWKPDITQLTQAGLENFTTSAPSYGSSQDQGLEAVQNVIDLYAHKKPSLTILEANMVPGDQNALWLQHNAADPSIRVACSRYVYASIDATALVQVQEENEALPTHEYLVVDMAKSVDHLSADGPSFDLIIIRTPASVLNLDTIYENARTLLRSGGHIMALSQKPSMETSSNSDGSVPGSSATRGSFDHTGITTPDIEWAANHRLNESTGSKYVNSTSGTASPGLISKLPDGFSTITNTVFGNQNSQGGLISELFHGRVELSQLQSHSLLANGFHIYFNELYTKQRHLYFKNSQYFESLAMSTLIDHQEPTAGKNVSLVHFSAITPSSLEILEQLKKHGWMFSYNPASSDLANIESSRILILDELSTSLFPELQEESWLILKNLATLGKRVLWVTTGSQMRVQDPEKAMVFGLSRTVRAEDPSISITCLDVDSKSVSQSVTAIDSVLETLGQDAPDTRVENEYVERDGTIYISRMQPDHLVNLADKQWTNGAAPVKMAIHDANTTIRMRCERIGNIDSLQYAEVATEEMPIRDNCVEVEIAAAGLNFKDVAITMGIVPENEYLLGLEGAGTIRRIGKSVDTYTIGQRVLVFEKGTFANRIEATTERVYPIPDSMTYEEASTLASVYLTALYSIYDLANTQKGHRVLLHSASGGLGIACIQICKYIGAEVFVTVGSDKKREFLKENFSIPDDHIFNSRTSAFALEVMRMTDGYGVDVILNSLTGDLLDASWRCIAEGGTMVELGKRDMLDRKSLAMEPFGRNASYRCFDMAHKHVTDTLIARLLTQLFGLLEEGHVKPISPIKTFTFDDIQSAFRYMRGANHIGKIVISNHGNNDFRVPVRPALRKLQLKRDASYIIIGGLKGLCGSLAIDLARAGAGNLVVVARSGYSDARSQGIIRNIRSEGCNVNLVQGDVSSLDDVRRAYKQASLPVRGIIQGAMVLRDKIFTSMTIEEYTQAVRPKVQGTWNLHNVALEEGIQLDFFTMLSSVSGVVGQKGQANYAAANVFLDSFASYRHGLGLPACSVDLGAIDDVGYMSEHKDILVQLDSAAWTPLNEALFLKIVRVSILQQVDTINKDTIAQLVTSIAVPQMEESYLLADARFSGLCFGQGEEFGGKNEVQNKEVQSFLMMIKAGAATADRKSVVQACVNVLNRQFTAILRLDEPMEPAKPLSSYGLDSLAAVELRNWVRGTLKAEITVLDITNAPSLISVGEKVVGKLTQK